MRSYWGDVAATQEAFKIINGHKYYKTGDSGYVKDGYLYFTGRNSDNYKLSNGKFIDVYGIESVIKRFVEGYFIICGENLQSNILITDSEISKNTKKKINQHLENYQKISNIIKIETKIFEDNLTKKLSLNRKNLVNQLNHPLLKQ
jgi:long-subunit acyl-CoA synthetase (AMP-forming)